MVGNDYKLEFDFKNILSDGICSYKFNIVLNAAKGFDVYMHGECGGSGFTGFGRGTAVVVRIRLSKPRWLVVAFNEHMARRSASLSLLETMGTALRT